MMTVRELRLAIEDVDSEVVVAVMTGSGKVGWCIAALNRVFTKTGVELLQPKLDKVLVLRGEDAQ